MLAPGAAAPPYQPLSDLLVNGPVLVFFFKISCPVCQLIAPFMERLSRSTSLQVAGVSQDDAASTKAFTARFGLTLPVVLDTSKAGYPASNQFGITSVPSLFLIESDAAISTAFSGFSKADLEALGTRAGVDIFKPNEQVPAFRAG